MTPEEITKYHDLRFDDAIFKLSLIACMFVFFVLVILVIVCTLSPLCLCYPYCPCGRAAEKRRLLKANVPRGEQIPNWKKKVSLHEINPSFWIPWNSRQAAPDNEADAPTLKDRLDLIGKKEYDNLNPSIYKAYESFGKNINNEPVTPIREEVSGTVIFSVRQEEDKPGTIGKYQVSLKAIRNLRHRPYGGLSYVYLKLHLIGRSSTKKKQIAETVIDEKKTEIYTREQETPIDEDIVLLRQEEFVGNEFMKISSYEFDKFSRHEWAGELSVPLSELDLSEEVMFTEDLKEPCQDFGEILLSLSYLPTSEKLHLCVIKCKNLTLRMTGDTLMFVKIVMIQGKNTLMKKRSRAVDACSSPTYNETLAFDVPQPYLDQVTYIISVNNRSGHEDLHARDQSERVVGTCTIGPVSSGTGREHWMNMVQTPRKATAMWHALR